MSSIKLSPNASGTGIFSIEAPNSSTNRTLTLPDASGTFLTNSGTEAGAFSTLSVNGNNISAVNSLGFRNRLINPGMVIDQRNAGASVTPANGAYVIDRYQVILSQASKYSVQQVTDAPTGFSYSMKITSLSAYSVVSSDIFHVLQKIEGFNVADLAWGTASAQAVTVSFWAKSSLTGTFGGSLVNSAEDRSYPFSYTINAANTWEYKTVTVPGDTTGTWLTTNGIGIRCHFTIGMGSTYTATAGAWTAGAKFAPTGATNVVGTNGATLNITGVQLEAGTVASPFERRDYGRELMMCQRYARTIGNGLSGIASATTAVVFNYSFEQPMRASPTATVTDTSILVSDQYSADITSTSSAITVSNQSSVGGRLGVNGFTGLTQGRFYSPIDNTNGSVFLLSAEL